MTQIGQGERSDNGSFSDYKIPEKWELKKENEIFVDYFLNNYGGGDKDVFSDLRPRFVELLEAHVARAIRLAQVEAIRADADRVESWRWNDSKRKLLTELRAKADAIEKEAKP